MSISSQRREKIAYFYHNFIIAMTDRVHMGAIRAGRADRPPDRPWPGPRAADRPHLGLLRVLTDIATAVHNPTQVSPRRSIDSF
jgi:hypothetical protein